MRATLEKMLAQIREYLGKMSRRSRIIAGILAVVIVALAIVAVLLLGQTSYVVLTTAQSQAEADSIFSVLEDMNVSPRRQGNTILVPENKVSGLGDLLTSAGVTGPAGPNLEILNMAASFNVTDSHARKLYEYQKAQDIRDLILQSPRIDNVSVNLNIGQTSTFVRPQNTNQATAAVMLRVAGSGTLTDAEAQTIADIVLNSVPGITYENITISDDTLRRYRIGNESEQEDFDAIANSRVMLTNMISKQFQEQGLQILTPIFGIKRVEIVATVTLNFDKVVIESIVFDPPVAGELDGIARSSSDIWEAVRRDDLAEGIPGTDTNAMGTVEYPYGDLRDNEYYAKMIRERNYEINETRTLIEKEQGKIETVNIAVTIDSESVAEDYTTEVRNLISRGMGIPLVNVEVMRAPFSNRDTSFQDAFDRWQEYDEQMKQKELLLTIIKYAVILLLGLAFIILVATIYRGSRPVPEPEPVFAEGPAGGAFDFIIGGEGDEEEILDAGVEIGIQKKSSGLEQIEKFIDKDPAAVAQLLRNWLTDE